MKLTNKIPIIHQDNETPPIFSKVYIDFVILRKVLKKLKAFLIIRRFFDLPNFSTIYKLSISFAFYLKILKKNCILFFDTSI